MYLQAVEFIFYCENSLVLKNISNIKKKKVQLVTL